MTEPSPDTNAPGGYVVVANADAGSTATEAVNAAVARLATHAPTQLEWTDTPDDCVEVVRRQDDDRQLVVAGGDGSVHLALATVTDLGRTGRPVGVIPLGTGNDFARNHGLPLEPIEAADIVIAGHTAGIDAMALEGDTGSDERGNRMVANNIHVGLGVRAAQTASKLKRVAHRLAYPIATAYEGVSGDPVDLAVTADGEQVWDGPLLACLVLLGPSMGGGVEMTPGDDDQTGPAGTVELILVEPADAHERIALVRAALRSRIFDAERAQRHRAKDVTLTGRDGVDVNVDGEMISYTSSVALTHRPDAWQVFVPRR